jgi:hypothetical protein
MLAHPKIGLEDLKKVDIERLGMLQEIKVSHKCVKWMKATKVNELFKVIQKIPTVEAGEALPVVVPDDF